MKDPAVSPNAHHPPAYESEEFLHSDDARPLRILAEYIAPLQAFRHARVQDTIVFFGSARLCPDGPLGRYYAEARRGSSFSSTSPSTSGMRSNPPTGPAGSRSWPTSGGFVAGLGLLPLLRTQEPVEYDPWGRLLTRRGSAT